MKKSSASWQRISHRARVTTISTFAAAFVLGVVLVATSYLLKRSSQDTAQRQLSGVTHRMAHRVNEIPPPPEVLSHILRKDQKYAFGIYDPKGKLVPNTNGGPLVMPEELQNLQFPGEYEFQIEKEPDGSTVAVGVNWSDRRAELAKVDLALIILWPSLVAVLSLVTFLAISKSFQPLHKLLHQAESLDFNDRLETSDDAEFGALANSINSYLARIQILVRQQEEFAVDAAHELCTPLTALRGQLELAILQKRDSQGFTLAAKNAVSQVSRLERLVDSLLLSARPQESDSEPHQVDAVIEAAQARWVDRFAEKRVELNAKVESSFAKMPSEEIDCVIDNLLGNALRFSPPESHVSIALSSTGLLTVHDQGAGVPEELRERVFERFERGSRRGRGFGIGLYLARRLLERRNGTIRIAPSEVGTLVEVHLPG